MPASTSVVARLPASTAQHVDALAPGTRLGEFEVQSLIGVGGFGMVYQAFDHSLQRSVAIKEYMPAALAGRADGRSLWVRSSSNEQSFQAGLASFVDEARLLARFDHPSLVKVFRFWEANHTAYMVMPLYRGMTLKQARAHMRTPPPEAWLRSLLWSVASALRVLHDGQTLHRDISPDNIFLQDRGPPVLLDLGAARHAIGGGSHRHAAVLKVNYAPLEQYTDAADETGQGPWSDLYALGAAVHGCLCNTTPQPATQRALRDRMLPMPRVARALRRQFGIDYSPAFVNAIGRCLALQPQNRPQSVTEFLQDMDMTAAPAGLESFDFRAALGERWVEPQAKDAPGVARPMMIGLTRSRSGEPVPGANLSPPSGKHPRRRQRTRAKGRGHATALAQSGEASGSGRAMGQARMMWAMAGSVAVMTLAGSLWWGQHPHRPHQTPESEIITEWAEPAAPSALMRATHEPAAGLPAPAAQPIAAITQSMPAQSLEPAGPPPAALARVVLPEPMPVVTPGLASGPEEACASAGFWTQSMCIHQECLKADMARHPVCVESRRRHEAQELQQELYAQ
ncbi:MAG: serine/threonine protein kinase [Proteobacteria bacterium]|nr:serine/threonine protein kinase [Pseudomonadota bacterium]